MDDVDEDWGEKHADWETAKAANPPKTSDWYFCNVEWVLPSEITTVYLRRHSDRYAQRIYRGYGKEFRDKWSSVPTDSDAAVEELMNDERFEEVESLYEMPKPIENLRDFLKTL